MAIALSTAALPLIPDPDALLTQWKHIAGMLPHVTLAMDPRLPVALQRALGTLARQEEIVIGELVAPVVDLRGRPLPRLGSPKRDEARAARQLLRELLVTAAENEVRRVILHPELLPLQHDIPRLQRRFARGETLHDEAANLRAESATLAPQALDSWRYALDEALERAATEEVAIHILGPTIWPHQVPCAAEVLELQDEFAGAPLAWQLATDWRHVRRILWDEDDDLAPRLPTEDTTIPADILAMLPAEEAQKIMAEDQTPRREISPASVRVADACGLEVRLPPGIGEIDWAEVDLGDEPRTLVCEGEGDELKRATAVVGNAP